MAAVKCSICGAAVTVTLQADTVDVSHGAHFRENCKTIKDPQSADFILLATECAEMKTAVDKAVRRMQRRAELRRLRKVPPPPPSPPETAPL